MTGSARDAVDRVYAARAKAGSLGLDGSMHLLSAVANCPEAAGLIDHQATFGYVWSTLGWNIHVYHSYLDVHPGKSGSEGRAAQQCAALTRLEDVSRSADSGQS